MSKSLSSATLLLSVVNVILLAIVLGTRPSFIVLPAGDYQPRALMNEARMVMATASPAEESSLPPLLAFRYRLYVLGDIDGAQAIADGHPEILPQLDRGAELDFARGSDGAVLFESPFSGYMHSK